MDNPKYIGMDVHMAMTVIAVLKTTCPGRDTQRFMDQDAFHRR